MIKTGLVTGITKTNDKITIQYSTDDGIRTAIYFNNANSYTIPSIDDTILINETKNVNYTIATHGNNSTSHETNEGELKIYAVDQNEVKSSVELKKNGQVIVNGGENYAVKFNQLKTKFDMLIVEINNFITTYNSHTHMVFNTPTLGPSAVRTASAININDSKADNLLIDDPSTEEAK